MNIEFYMEKVIEESRNRIYKNESPFAAGILVDNHFFVAGNLTRTKKNPNFHAEIMVINDYCEAYDADDLKRATIFTSCEPCLMCFHSILNAGIKKIVFAATIDDAIMFDSGDLPIHIREYASSMNFDITIIEKVLEEKAVNVFKECIQYRGEL